MRGSAEGGKETATSWMVLLRCLTDDRWEAMILLAQLAEIRSIVTNYMLNLPISQAVD
jgi:hypothetical protein